MTIPQNATVPYDLLIIGGGINGCGIARDAAGRGLRVALAEMGDLAQGTSSASTKLIHGGLRYLEHYDFSLVREALIEREVLLGIAPHIVQPLRFVLPHLPGMRPAWMLRLGLFIYDHLGGRRVLPGSRTFDLRRDAAGAPLKPGFVKGFEYSDCQVDDSRLVILNAMAARLRGAEIMTRTRVLSAVRDGDLWRVEIQREGRTPELLLARALVNAGGAWAHEIGRAIAGQSAGGKMRLVQGSHIVVPKLYDHGRAYIFQNRDGRIVFAIPWEGDFTLIGTTDHDYAGDPAKVSASEEEIAYLLAAIAEYFAKPPRREDIVWTYSGVRALVEKDGASAKDLTREYSLALDAEGPPLLTITGGKITTYRTLAEAALARLAPYFPAMPRASWTGGAALPGGELPAGGMVQLSSDLQGRYPWLEPRHLARMAHSYGTMTANILGAASGIAELGEHFGAGLYAAEIEWLRAHEWARTADDVLWRRSKLGLHVNAGQRAALARFLGEG